MNRFKILLSVLFIVHAGYSQGTLNSFKTNQIWFDLNVSTPLSESINFYAKIGAKTVSPKVWNKLYLSSEISYNLQHLIFKNFEHKETVYGGVDFYFIDFIDSENAYEISPYQGYSLYWPNNKKLTLKHNLEFAERLQWIKNIDKYSFGIKASYELDLSYKIFREPKQFVNGFYIGMSAKFWWNLIAANIYNDIIRITPKVGYQFSPKWKISLFTGYNYTRNFSTTNFHSDNIIYRFRIYYNI
ncbi:DUF2490 domain-containing protein [Labilibacter marinus]|uniref:DUF2490 domain-containing protein n=1 Tax=Labilibacter marinus TaxID=1477105 RepID=UPI0009501403|nr:DUF2490 domain-containing protein [Labilibacter marinus]